MSGVTTSRSVCRRMDPISCAANNPWARETIASRTMGSSEASVMACSNVAWANARMSALADCRMVGVEALNARDLAPGSARYRVGSVTPDQKLRPQIFLPSHSSGLGRLCASGTKRLPTNVVFG